MANQIYKSFEELPVMLTIPQVASVLSISRAGAYELAHRKNFPAMLVGSRIVVPKDRLLAESVQTVAGKAVIRQAGTRKPGNSFTKVFWQGHKPSVSGSFGKRSGIGNIKQRR